MPTTSLPRLVVAMLVAAVGVCTAAGLVRAEPPDAPVPPEPPQAAGQAGDPESDPPAAEAKRLVPETPREPGPIDLPADAALVHKPTGLVLPPQLAQISRTSAYSYDDQATNLSAGYNDRRLRMIVTLYLYSSHPVEADFNNAAREIAQVLEGMHRRLGGQIENLPEPLGETHWATFATDGPTRQLPFAASSFLSVTSIGEGEDGRPYVIKLRLTYPTEHHEDVVRRMAELIADWMEANGHEFPQIRDAAEDGAPGGDAGDPEPDPETRPSQGR